MKLKLLQQQLKAPQPQLYTQSHIFVKKKPIFMIDFSLDFFSRNTAINSFLYRKNVTDSIICSFY